MKWIYFVSGWSGVILLIVLFTDMVMAIRVGVYKERSLSAELAKKNFFLKCILLLLALIINLFSKQLL